MATVEWVGDGVRLIDQTRLPEQEAYVLCTTAEEVAGAIRRMVVRGAPAIGAAAAYGMALAALQGHQTVSVLFGHAAAGAFIAAGLSSESLVALPGAEASVMDLPSISRVTKLPLEQLQDLAKSTPIFAPGIASPCFRRFFVGLTLGPIRARASSIVSRFSATN